MSLDNHPYQVDTDSAVDIAERLLRDGQPFTMIPVSRYRVQVVPIPLRLEEHDGEFK
jgi:hypothetical protein